MSAGWVHLHEDYHAYSDDEAGQIGAVRRKTGAYFFTAYVRDKEIGQYDTLDNAKANVEHRINHDRPE